LHGVSDDASRLRELSGFSDVSRRGHGLPSFAGPDILAT